MKKILHSISLIFLMLIFATNVFSQNLKKITISGNERVSDETIIMFSELYIDQKINNKVINEALKKLYNTNFFDNVAISFNDDVALIKVIESPVIQNISIEGIKAKKNREIIEKTLSLKSRSSLNSFLLSKEKKNLETKLRELGYYFANVQILIENLEDNKVNIKYDIDLGDKAKIKKISFIGDKKFKDGKLRSIIISEEYKFWKFLSGKKFLNEDIISLDQRLLKNFYLNNGYYNVQINTSFAKLIKDDEFELLFNINADKKIFFNDLKINFPNDFEINNFDKINNNLRNLKGKPYSLYSVEKILDDIDSVTLNEEFKTVKASVVENLIDGKLNILFKIEESDLVFVERINIFGNNVTREDVIRNQLVLDEGDPYNDILRNKSINNLKNLNFFKNVSSEVIDGENSDSKIINISIEEKATGEISAGAGVGTSGGTIAVGVRENNYLGKGIALNANATLTQESFKGKFSVSNPNYKNTDKTVFANIQAIEIDQIKNFGYKTNKTGFEVGTIFEYLEDLNFGLSTRSFYEKIETDSTASKRQKKQEGDYWDTFINLNFDYDKRNQKFKTTDGYRSNFTIDLPFISETNTLTNSYNLKLFKGLYENNISSFSIFLQSANSITGDDIKLSERLTIPSSKLRGFERGKVGPKDGNDFIGGNFLTAINFNTTLPKLFENSQNLDALIFLDAANLWGIDYDSSLNDGSKIRSSIGIGIDWFTPIGPMSFSLSETITKDDTDITESFRFNIGTTF